MLKPYLNCAACFVVCFAVYSAPVVDAEADSLPGVSTDKPNVIFIKTDDQRFDSLSMTGHPVTQTPNIDQLATEGVFFSKAFITSPICGPSRANFFTGQWERKNRVGFSSVSGNFVSTALFDNSWLMQLKRAGYFSGYIGKHHTHVGEKKDRNRYMKQNLDFCYMKSGHLGFNLLTRKEFSNLKNGSQIEGLFEATEAFIGAGDDKDYFFANADASLRDFLNRRDPNKPFCLSINFNLPHAAITDQGYPRMEAVRGLEWKYIRYFSRVKDRKRYLPDESINGEQPIFEELFNLKADPREQVNLANQSEHKEILNRYRSRCQKLVHELAQ